jgi:hypothetical protein
MISSPFFKPLMIAPVLTSENQNQWLSAAASLSKRELEKEIAKEFPEKQILLTKEMA